MRSLKLSAINKKIFKIDKWAPVSQLFFDLGFFGLILVILSFFFIPWYFLWVYVIFIIFISGFIFAKPGKMYNFSLVIIIFLILTFIPSKWGQVTLIFNPMNPGDQIENDLLDYITGDNAKPDDETRDPGDDDMTTPAPDFTHLYDKINDLSDNPMKDWDTWMENFMDVLNWIVFLCMCGFGLAGLGDALKLDFGAVMRKAGMIALTIAVMSVIYGILSITDVTRVKTIPETVGEEWINFLRNMGIASLDTRGNTVINTGSVTNGLFMWVPILTVILMFIFAIQFRKSDFKSIMFVNTITEENAIIVKRTRFSIPVLIILCVLAIFYVGYFLLTADPVININPLISIVFYISSIVVLFLLGQKVLIIHRDQNTKTFITSIFKWTLIGLMGLMLWYNVLTPICYNLNLTESNQLYTLSQGMDEDILRSPVITMLFMVAMPETLIFQVLIIGVVNRVYYYFRKERLLEQYETKLELKKENLMGQLENIKIIPNSTSKANLRNMAKYLAIQKQIEKIDHELSKEEKQKIPFSFFILPTLLAALMGSFIFSDYHRFRRGISFDNWWKNPSLGLVYFGAGFFLSLICFFNWIAAILVHWLNNIIAIALGG